MPPLGGLPAQGAPPQVVFYFLLHPLVADYEVRDGKLCVVPLAKPKTLADYVGPPQSWFRKRLKEPHTIRGGIAAGTPLRDALDRLALELEAPIIIDTTMFARAGIKDIARKPVRLAEERKVPLRAIPGRLLEPLGTTFVARDNLAVVVPARTEPRAPNASK